MKRFDLKVVTTQPTASCTHAYKAHSHRQLEIPTMRHRTFCARPNSVISPKDVIVFLIPLASIRALAAISNMKRWLNYNHHAVGRHSANSSSKSNSQHKVEVGISGHIAWAGLYHITDIRRVHSKVGRQFSNHLVTTQPMQGSFLQSKYATALSADNVEEIPNFIGPGSLRICKKKLKRLELDTSTTVGS